MLSIRLCEVRFHRLNMKTRFPFRYGIASMTEAPHLFVLATVEVDGVVCRGLSADGLPPKWFTKNLETTFEEDDLPSMLRVVRQAADAGLQLGIQRSFFAWWHELYEAQHAWATKQSIPQLLAGFGVSLIERAVLDAICRSLNSPLFNVLRRNVLEIDFASIRPELRTLTPADVLPTEPMSKIAVRHTVGLGDVLSSASDAAAPTDGLPFTFEENIGKYGLRFFKIKLSGDLSLDRLRLEEIADVINRRADDAKFTLDGNENYRTISEFRNAWMNLIESVTIRQFFEDSLLFVEQPVHRDQAFDDSVAEELRTWKDAPPVIIDESDAELSSFPIARSLGYAGTSHKNCKGIIKGLINCASIRYANRNCENLILSAEDLGNVGPVALLQDLAVVASMGISHVERNGHHYFAGLSMFPPQIQGEMLVHHGDLYVEHEDFVSLNPKQGMLPLDSINAAPFGLHPVIDVEQFEEVTFPS